MKKLFFLCLLLSALLAGQALAAPDNRLPDGPDPALMSSMRPGLLRASIPFAGAGDHLTDETSSAEEPPSGGVSGALPVINQGKGAAGVLSGKEKLGAGFVDMKGEGTFDPNKAITVQKSARPIRRIVKQDVYGRALPESFYFYRNMLNDNEKKLYDQIYANAAELDPYFEIATRVPHARMDSIIIAVRYDNPDLFWLDTRYRYTYDKNGNISTVTLQFNDAAKNIGAFRRQFHNAADSVLEYAMTLRTDIEKIKYCHDLLTNLNIYKWGNMNQSAYSALCIGQTVCAGYSLAFQYLMQRLGIPCAVVYGYAREDHLWNLVYLGGDYYEMDVTWDDPIGNPAHIYYYNYFNITSGQISKDHRRQGISTSLPQARGSVYSYANYFSKKPGSDFSRISYGKPRRSLPPVYPVSAASPPPRQANADVSSGDKRKVQWNYAKVDAWLEGLSEDEWGELWETLSEGLSKREIQRLADMEWDAFVKFMVTVLNE